MRLHISTYPAGPVENRGPTYRPFSGNSFQQGNLHSLDNWGPQGGHDWPYGTPDA